ncbi:molybdenum ABC transporter, periplasmic molybdate-binding protein [Ectothiorhodospira sp. PHS-1]|uniref:molybdate ABC transporter substrate-binding protein n=1 Tax=Ectothiorhodospira sp. PHS-1 TaxID=519989 RepID=UPI00024A81F2|nr:molybdate ABC transporter substrate-binding protein [Ectothiorhodospira sp. PHS-1]EHQ52625.1 molybdenum ABC transporter, periplasmic molybdate-binding protein [Ectothiorhodospira sp. PHS-1]
MQHFLFKALAGLILLALTGTLQAQEPTRIAAAADLRFAMDEILEAYREDHPDRPIEVIYGSSGRFRAQIENGAPFDLYFSADIEFPRMLQEKGFAASEVIPYAIGRIVLWSNTVDASTLTLSDLSRPEFRRIAIANPRHAPYGKRAEEALRAVGLWDELMPRFVFGENIAHTLQLVESSAAQVGIVALSLTLNPHVRDQGPYHLVDDGLHEPLEQGFIITRRAADNANAHHFAEYMNAPMTRAIMRAYGFVLPGE